MSTLPLTSKESVFLWGPRQTGKSTLIHTLFPNSIYYDLLLSREYLRLMKDPGLLKEDLDEAGLAKSNQKVPVIIDEIQKVPAILDEIHWLIENRGIRFLLCSSSARKLKRGHANLLGGRAVRYELHPLVYPEIPDFSLMTALNHGLLPRHYKSASPNRLIQAYIGNYLKEEIAAEALVRNIQSFSRFLEVAAISNGELIKYLNISRECGVSAPTVKEYFQIAVDTLIGTFLPAFTKRVKRRLIEAPKFYFFDIGIVAELTRRGRVNFGSELFGKAFEHFIVLEVFAYCHYSELYFPMAYWRTASQFEIDLVLGDHEVGIEIKATQSAKSHHLKGLRAFQEEYKTRRLILVSNDPKPRKTSDGIQILPWATFLKRLWNGKII